MTIIAHRFKDNPIISPKDVKPSRTELEVESVFNPAAFHYQGRVGLLLRVAERPKQQNGKISVPIGDGQNPEKLSIIHFDIDDPKVTFSEPRKFTYDGHLYLTTRSHLRLAWSEDGQSFAVDDQPTLLGKGELETYGIEDPRITEINDQYFVTYTQVSPYGGGVGLITTENWKNFQRQGMIFPPSNKDCAIFPKKINNQFLALNRPTTASFGDNIWLARSPDSQHWGDHQPVAITRPNSWDEKRIGVAGVPIETEHGWLTLYHGMDRHNRYRIGALLLDLNNPANVLARTTSPIMEPHDHYEKIGFFPNVVFSCGALVNNDILTLYYGAADKVIGGATLSLIEILKQL